MIPSISQAHTIERVRDTRSRVASIDALRGAVMIIMALDHVRDFLHSEVLRFRPEDMARTTVAIFLTRWITHFCAPVFMFTAGVGAFLWLQRGRTKAELSRFLLTRGLWLILLEITAERVAVNFSFSLRYPLLLIVLWALGWSMIVLAVLAHLPPRVLAAIALASICLHDLLNPIRASQFGALAPLWIFLHQPGGFQLGSTTVVIGYPLVPWFAVMAAGFCYGRILLFAPAERRRWHVWLGSAMVAAFVVLRAINIYGDPARWSGPRWALSFLNTTKYPPSLDFLLMTLGPALLALAWLDRKLLALPNPLIVYGRVPLFFFIVHMFVAHAAAVIVALFRYGVAWFAFQPPPSPGNLGNLYPADFGIPLWGVYLAWVSVVALLYPVCLWFARLKERRRDWWLSYL